MTKKKWPKGSSRATAKKASCSSPSKLSESRGSSPPCLARHSLRRRKWIPPFWPLTIYLELISNGNIAQLKTLYIVRAGFAHKRKLLKEIWRRSPTGSALNGAWKRLELNEKARAEDITVGQWLLLSTELRKRP